MPIPSPFHARVAEHCTSMFYKDWGGYYAVRSYDTTHDREYYAFRYACGMIDVTPLFKYDVTGPDAAAYLSRVTVKDISKLRKNQVTYLCWCDQQGKVIDDGTVTRLEKDHFRVTAAEPSMTWFKRFTRGYDVTITDMSDKIAALALQGPTSRDLLKAATDANLDKLRFFRATRAKLNGQEVIITRTGYTGDLGYEVWVENDGALAVWDGLMEHRVAYGVEPCGLDALDVTRIEAGFVMNGVDYHSAHHCLIEARKSSPFELGLGWTLQLERDPFIGQDALMKEAFKGSGWSMVGLEIDWPDYERVCALYDLPPQICNSAWRTSVPIYEAGGGQIGYATSGSWSPILKRNLALATLRSGYANIGTTVDFEVTVEHTHHKVKATVVDMPFYNPERKRSLP